jgi:hypothetical protein
MITDEVCASMPTGVFWWHDTFLLSLEPRSEVLTTEGGKGFDVQIVCNFMMNSFFDHSPLLYPHRTFTTCTMFTGPG